jgi:hypothetical protein
MLRSKHTQFKAYQDNGGSLSIQQWENEGHYDNSMEFTNEQDLANFKEWLTKISIPCKCGYQYKVDQTTINLVELGTPEHIALTGSPFHFRTHDMIACSNPSCNRIFSYPETAYTELYLRVKEKE